MMPDSRSLQAMRETSERRLRHNPLPAVSLGMPVFNEEKGIGKVIEEILLQSHTDMELIIADNASTDRTVEIAERYAELDPRIRIIRHKENSGAVANFACVAHAARGKYFAWVGAHDYYHPRWIETLLWYLEDNEDCVLACPRVVNFTSDGAVFLDKSQLTVEKKIAGDFRGINELRKHGNFGDLVYGLMHLDALRCCRIHVVCWWDSVLITELAVEGRFILVPRTLRGRLVGAPPKRATDGVRLQVLRRQYKILFPEGYPLRKIDFSPSILHLFLIFRDKILRHPNGWTGTRTSARVLFAILCHAIRVRHNMRVEFAYFRKVNGHGRE